MGEEGARRVAEARILRAVVAAENPVIGEGLRSILASLHVEVAAIAESCAAALAQARELAPDLILMEAQALLRAPEACAADGTAPLVVVGLGDGPGALALAVEVGACAYLGRDPSPACLRLAIESARRGYMLVERRCLLALVEHDELAAPPPARAAADARLTVRERQVLGLLAQGLSYEGVARALSLSAATVRTHTRRLCGKIGVRGRAAAVRWAIANGMEEG